MLIYGLIVLFAFTPSLIWADAVAAASAAASAAAAMGLSVASVASAASAAASASVFNDIFLPVTVNHRRCNCSLTYEPVCGSNGVAYSNKCTLGCVNRDRINRGHSPLRLQHHGLCRKFSCKCPQTIDPVCGSNNQTYPNDCHRACVNSYRTDNELPPIKLAHKGVCQPTLCCCPDSIIPVCGTDVRTYRNICFLQCWSRINQAHDQPPIFVKKRGPCRKEACNCPLIERNVCASDGGTYYSKCSFDCHNRRRNELGMKSLILQYPGDCIKCTCPAEIDPVCGSDGNTYSNYCLLLCKNRTRKRQNVTDLTVRWGGPCDCNCTKKYRPVCSSDRITWSNRCLLECENKKRALTREPCLSVLHEGECSVCNCEHCPNEYNPVCGSDNFTYQSSCLLTCINKCRMHDGQSPVLEIDKGECCH